MSIEATPWHRVQAKDKLAFHEDLLLDPTLSGLAKRMISVIAQNWDGSKMSSECSLSFIAAGAGTTKRMVGKYADRLIASGRVSVVQQATFTASTLYSVNWWYRGSTWVRQGNNDMPITDCRLSPLRCQSTVGEGVPQEVWSQSPTQGTNSCSKEQYTAAPGGAGTGVPAWGAAEESERNPRQVARGFSKWRIVHAEYEGVDEDVLVAHLRSGNGRRFVFRCDIESGEHDSLDEALWFDGDPASLRGKLVQMSTNRSGPKSFMRTAPLPWTTATVLSEKETDRGADVRMRFHEPDQNDATLQLDADDAQRLAQACGGPGKAIGACIRYRLMPDDIIEFRRIAEANDNSDAPAKHVDAA
jgi:hypothetical protein